jgi:Flp pilus assembly protein TadB
MTDPELEDQESRQTRIRQARQVLAGDTIRPSPDPWVLGSDAIPLSALQRNYLVTLIVLLLLGVILAYIIGLGVASIVLFVLALGLVAAWLVF